MNQPSDSASIADDKASARMYMQRVGDGLDALERLRGKVSQLLGAQEIDAGWLERLERIVDELLLLSREHADLALYYLVNEKVNNPQQYSALHSVCCALMAVLAAQWLDWQAEEVRSLGCASLTMNIAMGALQDQLARQVDPPSAGQRELIGSHAERGAEALRKAGVSDPLWLQAVQEHHIVHDAPDAQALEPGPRAAELLRRVDVYAAKLSTRKTRPALTPAKAARGALLGPSDHPDAMGATLLRVLGLYPPGAYVELLNGEVGVVIERGERAHTPLVASLRRQDGNVLLVPRARDTALRPFSVRRGVDAAQVHVRPGHVVVLKARLQLGGFATPPAPAAQPAAADAPPADDEAPPADG